MFRIAALLTTILLLPPGCGAAPDQTATSTAPIGPEQIGVIVNDLDPDSVAIAEYYAAKRRIPAGNLVHVRFAPGNRIMQPAEFRDIKALVDRDTPEQVQAYALTWTKPFRVGCMSITTAFAAGFDAGFCAAGCSPTSRSPYFDSASNRPYSDYGWRPAMLLAGNNVAAVKTLIDRGVAADQSRPKGTAYLLSTTDQQRNVRARFYQGIELFQSDRFRVKALRSDSLKHREDVLFYFTGLPRVPDIETNHYLPGAIADHLTSAGGVLDGTAQMSSLRWLDAGATGSYGAVVEPCNFVDKFPRPNIVIDRYLNGETLLESYWKSVATPGQGVFIGEPLARPFARQ